MTTSKIVESPEPNKVAVVVGTRPGIIKMSPLVDELQDRSAECVLIHAGQHYSYELDKKIFNDLGLSTPDHRIQGIDEKEFHGEQTAAMLVGIERVLLEERPESVLVCGDANFNLAGALAARKTHLTLGHVEAGLRSDDWRMPEEHNRIMIDHISDHLFCPTENTAANARKDDVHGEIHVTGNTIVDAVNRNAPIAHESSGIHEEIGISPGEYAVFTAHREENVDSAQTLSRLIETIRQFIAKTELEVVFPAHPRTTKRAKQFELLSELEGIEGLHLTEPIGYLDFLNLLDSAEIALTDSGGIQEESCILGVPCVTLRENTERPETVSVGANVVAGTDPETVINEAVAQREVERDWENPFGDGTAAVQIIDEITS